METVLIASVAEVIVVVVKTQHVFSEAGMRLHQLL